ncbi:MAG: hypothetical protein NVV83_08300 [Afipia sp.]|nr:hypothetical protein [Afipia sp.]
MAQLRNRRIYGAPVGGVAFAITVLTRANIERAEAAQRVATKFRGLRSLLGKGARDSLAKSILTWHDKFHYRTCDNSEAVEMYDSLMGALKETEDSKRLSPKDYERFALRHLSVTAKIKPITKEQVLSSVDREITAD